VPLEVAPTNDRPLRGPLKDKVLAEEGEDHCNTQIIVNKGVGIFGV
jgi:hypothetical protein